MANYKQCQNGHYYDPTLYSECPYCTDLSQNVGGGTSFVGGGRTVSVSNAENPYPTPPRIPTADPAQGSSLGSIPTVNVVGGLTPDVSKTKPSNGGLGGETIAVGLMRDSKEDGSRYVVGWLVAIEGPYKGQSFEVHNGYTSVGREKGDIVLKKDKQVSAENNISTVYDAVNNCFYISAGESRNLVHFNGAALLSGMSKEMHAYDSINIGGTKLLFVPFCSDCFNWNDGETKETGKSGEKEA